MAYMDPMGYTTEPLKIPLSHLIIQVGRKRFPNPMGPIIIPSKPGRIKSPFSQSIHQGILFMAHVGLSENVGYSPNDIAIFHRDNDQQNHWV